jgi:hypothetical protein
MVPGWRTKLTSAKASANKPMAKASIISYRVIIKYHSLNTSATKLRRLSYCWKKYNLESIEENRARCRRSRSCWKLIRGCLPCVPRTRTARPGRLQGVRRLPFVLPVCMDLCASLFVGRPFLMVVLLLHPALALMLSHFMLAPFCLS